MDRAIVPLGAIGMLGIILFPLPRGALDFLLVVNLSFSMLLLLSVLYVAEPARFTSLPAVLLISTLFRLALNISTTRLLLGEGDAPQVVRAFGEFVVGGDLLVGVVVFAMLTLVQFLVVAKGAERVAEVAARFTLDAMPGKQMAIDADIRAGILSIADAKQRRVELQRESHLYGALDGAMKFVKGDAIAGVVIIFVNITAGLYTGVERRGLTVSVALREYTLLTVGDGLLAQLPALLIAVAAGIAVTRVGGQGESGLGGELLAQLSREPKPLLFSALGLGAVGLFPRVPFLPFVSVAAALAFFALRRAAGTGAFGGAADSERQLRSYEPQVSGGMVFVAAGSLIARVKNEGRVPELYAALKRELFERWGLIFPDLAFECDDRLAEGQVAVFMRGVTLCRAELPQQETQVSEWVAQLLGSTVAAHRGWLVDDTQIRVLLDLYHQAHEDSINAVVPKLLSVTALATLVRELVEEGLSVRPLASILQAIAECPAEVRSCQASLVENVRPALARTISSSLSEDGLAIRVHLLNDQLQDRLLGAVVAGEVGERVWLTDGTREVGVGGVRRELVINRSLIVLCPAAIRRQVSALLRSPLTRMERERVVVVSPQELMPEFELVPVGKI